MIIQSYYYLPATFSAIINDSLLVDCLNNLTLILVYVPLTTILAVQRPEEIMTFIYSYHLLPSAVEAYTANACVSSTHLSFIICGL